MAGGRPTKLTPEIIEQAKNYCILGASNRDLVQFLRIAETTLYRWMTENKEFKEAINVGKDEANDRVGKALYSKACGYSVKESKVYRENGETVIVDVDKHFQPDTTSMIFWLKNRDSDNWKDVKERIDTHKFGDDAEVNPLELARRVAFLLTEGLEAPIKTH